MTTPYTTPDALWQAALDELRLQMTRAAYDTWLGGSHALLPASSDQQLVVAVRSPYAPAWLTQRLGKMIHATLAELTGRPVTVTYVTADSTTASQPVQPSHPTPVTPQGTTIMNNQSQPQAPTVPATNGQTRVRLYSHLTQSRFLHIEDSLQIGKLRMLAHKQMVSEPPSYLLVPTTSEVDNDASGMDGTNGSGPRPLTNGTAVFPPTRS
jgi:chromosomal replication initiation ATPase DnaA